MSVTYKPVTLNKLNCTCLRHIINILLTELSQSVWENLDLGRVYRPHCVRSVLTTSVKILPYRPPAQLIRAKYKQQIYKYAYSSLSGLIVLCKPLTMSRVCITLREFSQPSLCLDEVIKFYKITKPLHALSLVDRCV